MYWARFSRSFWLPPNSLIDESILQRNLRAAVGGLCLRTYSQVSADDLASGAKKSGIDTEEHARKSKSEREDTE